MAISASSPSGMAISASSVSNDGVHGVSANGTGIYGKGGKNAGQFDGNVLVNGTVTVTGDIVLANADCAEEFDVAAVNLVEPGTVMVLSSGGALQPSECPYDKRVAGVVSGAGDYRPGVILDRKNTSDASASARRVSVALVGKTACKVDAQYGTIEVGDLLTTSSTPGHAMKATDSDRAFGCVIGKAMQKHENGRGIVPILIALSRPMPRRPHPLRAPVVMMVQDSRARDPAKSFMRSEAVLACAGDRGRGGGWRRRCWRGRRGAGG